MVLQILREWQETGESSVVAERLRKVRSRDRDVEM